MYSLFLDTHDKKVTIILFKDGKVIDHFELISNNKHSVITLPAIKNILENNNLLVKDLNEVIVVNGPGSFTGERIAVTIAKTMAFALNIPIKVIDSLSVMAININSDDKYVAISDRNGAFVGHFDKNNSILEPFVYLSTSDFLLYSQKYKVYENVDINYELVYSYVKQLKSVNPHEVKPLYVKGISVLNDKRA